MSITHVNDSSNLVVCWVGRQTSRRRVNAVIIMVYTAHVLPHPSPVLKCVHLSVMLSQQTQNVQPMLVLCWHF